MTMKCDHDDNVPYEKLSSSMVVARPSYKKALRAKKVQMCPNSGTTGSVRLPATSLALYSWLLQGFTLRVRNQAHRHVMTGRHIISGTSAPPPLWLGRSHIDALVPRTANVSALWRGIHDGIRNKITENWSPNRSCGCRPSF
jgi:hypothetical protein